MSRDARVERESPLEGRRHGLVVEVGGLEVEHPREDAGAAVGRVLVDQEQHGALAADEGEHVREYPEDERVDGALRDDSIEKIGLESWLEESLELEPETPLTRC